MFAGARMSELWLRSGSGSLRSLRAGLAAHPEPRGAPAALPAARLAASNPALGGGSPPLHPPTHGRVTDPTALVLAPIGAQAAAALAAPPPGFPDSARRPPAAQPAPSFLHSFGQRTFLGRLRHALHKALPTFREWPPATRLPCSSLAPPEAGRDTLLYSRVLLVILPPVRIESEARLRGRCGNYDGVRGWAELGFQLALVIVCGLASWTRCGGQIKGTWRPRFGGCLRLAFFKLLS